MKRNHLVLITVLLFALLCVLWNFRPSVGRISLAPRDTKGEENRGNLSHAVASKDGAVGMFLEHFKTPIEIHGRVEDQHGKPVKGATVTLSPGDTPWESSNSKITIQSDEKGKFSVKGLRGAFMGVSVEKAGYLYIPPVINPASSKMVYYADGAADGKRYSNPEMPLILRLHDPGQMEPLVHVLSRRLRLPANGKPYLVALNTEEGEGVHQIEFRFFTERFNLPDDQLYSKQYDWGFEARIPGGGFAWGGSDYEFEAPEDGYKELVKVEYRADMPQDQWKKLAQGLFFVKFADGCHGRIRFIIEGFSDRSPLMLESWLNPKPGSRNLATPHISSSFASEERFAREWRYGDVISSGSR